MMMMTMTCVAILEYLIYKTSTKKSHMQAKLFDQGIIVHLQK